MSFACILRFYPHAWRERYQDEMMALLELHTVTPFTLLDLLLGALDARLDPQYRGSYTIRPVVPAFLASFPLFMLAVCYWVWQLQDPPAAFYGSLDAANDITNGATLVSVSYITIFISFLLVLLSILLGSLLIVSITAWKASTLRGYRNRFLVWLSLLATVLSLVGFGVAFFQEQSFFFIFWLLAAALATLCTWILMPGRREMSRGSRRLLLVPAIIGSIAMSLFLLADLIWGLGLLATLTFVASMPVLPQGSWLAAWIINCLLLAISTSFVLFMLLRGAMKTTT